MHPRHFRLILSKVTALWFSITLVCHQPMFLTRYYSCVLVLNFRIIVAEMFHPISQQDQLFLTLLKLCCNFSHKDFGVRFSVSPSTITNITITWINVLHKVLYVGLLKNKIPSVSKNRMCLPSCFSNFRTAESFSIVPKYNVKFQVTWNLRAQLFLITNSVILSKVLLVLPQTAL